LAELILVERASQVREFRHLVVGNPIWVATGPGAMHELGRLGIGYAIPEDYYAAEQLHAVGEKSRAAAMQVCRVLDARLGRVSKEFADARVTYRFEFYNLSALMDLLAARMFQLDRIVRAVRPTRVWTAKFSGGAVRGAGRFTYGALLALDGWPTTVQPVIFFRASPAPPVHHKVGGCMACLFPGTWLYRLISAGRTLFWNLRLSRGNDRHACFHLVSPECKAVAGHLSRHRTRISIFPMRDWAASVRIPGKIRQEICRDLEQDVVFRRQFWWYGIDTYPLLAPYVRYLVQSLSIQLVNAYSHARSYFRDKRVSVLLTRNKARAVDHSICRAAQDLGVRVFNWQHGSTGFAAHRTLEYAELLTTDIFLAYGRGVHRAQERIAAGYGATVVPVGSPSLERLKSTWRRKCKRVDRLPQFGEVGRLLCIYVTTNYLEHRWYAGYTPPFSDTLFYQTQVVLLQGLLAVPSLRVVVKLHPNPMYTSPPWVESFAAARFLTVIRDQCSFTDLLAYADLIVLDWPSTTLLQALVTDRPVFVLTKHRKLYPEALVLLSRRAVLAAELEEMAMRVRTFAETGRYPADVCDSAFLLDYGLHRSDGSSRERAADFIAGGDQPGRK
jgi:hypothetical protein